MVEELQSAKDEVRRKARELAKAAGKEWRSLSKDDRLPYIRAARSGGKGSERSASSGPSSPTAANPWRDDAIKKATSEGKRWRELPKEERQKYLATAREEWNRKLAQDRKRGS